MYSITSKFNSTFGTSGKATADKMSGKCNRETQPFALEYLLSCSEARLKNFEQFWLLVRFFPGMKVY